MIRRPLNLVIFYMIPVYINAPTATTNKQPTTLSLSVERPIRIQNVGRIDSNLHDLHDYQIPAKVSTCEYSGHQDR